MADLTAPTSAPASSTGEAWSFPRRFIAVFTSPKALFEHLDARPSWFVPFLVSLAFVILFLVILWHPVILPQVLEKLDEKGAPDNAVEMMTKNGLTFQLIGVLIVASALAFFSALVAWVVGGFILGGSLTYRKALAITTHASLVTIPALLVIIPLALISRTAEVSVGPGMLYLARDAEGFGGKYLASLLTFLDVFRLWQNALVVVGVSVIGRLPRGKAAVGMWTAYVVLALVGALLSAVLQR
jgi:hypothetical protein